MRDPVRGFTSALGLLTRVPVPARDLVPGMAGWFPVVGLVVGLMGGGSFLLLATAAPRLVAAVVAVAVTAAITGALHEDGLADYADALGAGARGEPALQIMADPRVGTFGVLALLFSVVFRVAAVAGMTPVAALVWLTVAHAGSRAGTAALAWKAPAVRGIGLGAGLAATTDRRSAVTAVAVAFGVAVAAVGVWAVPAALVSVIAVGATHRSASRRLGGVTGDVLGFCQQLAEMGLLGLGVVISPTAAPGWSGLL